MRCDKDRNIVKALNATKKEEFPDLKGTQSCSRPWLCGAVTRLGAAAMKDMYDRKAMQAEKARRKKAKEAERQRVEEAKAEADRRDYRCVPAAPSAWPSLLWGGRVDMTRVCCRRRHMMSADNMRLNSEFSATADDSAAKEYEDSFM